MTPRHAASVTADPRALRLPGYERMAIVAVAGGSAAKRCEQHCWCARMRKRKGRSAMAPAWISGTWSGYASD